MDKVDDEGPEWLPATRNTRGGRPNWWNTGGESLVNRSRSLSKLIIANETSRLVISPLLVFKARPILFTVTWQIWPARENGPDYFGGSRQFDVPTLKAAFGLIEMTHISGKWVLGQHRANAARHGYFIRFGKFTKIPGPGLGVFPDPNISILLTPRITRLVGAAIKKAHQAV